MGSEFGTGAPVNLDPTDLERHCYILGATGCGKTTLISTMIEQDISNGQTIVIVDLRGDLVTGVLSICLRQGIAHERVTMIDLREKRRVQAFNPLQGSGEPFIRALHVLDVVANEAESWGVQLEETLRCALLLLAQANEPLTGLEQIFFDNEYRHRCLGFVSDDSLQGFWERYDNLNAEKKQSFATPVLNKVTSLLAVPSLRQLFSGDDPMDLGALLNTPGQIFLVSLAVDELHRSSRMVGSLVVSAIAREVMARVNVPENRRNPVRLYVDEFENMASESFNGLIAEGRRFKLTLVLSHQTLAQLSSKLRSVVRNNAGLQILFQCGFEDATIISRELETEKSPFGLRDLPVGHAFVVERTGSARLVQFCGPKSPITAEAIETYRQGVLARIKLPSGPVQPKPSAHSIVPTVDTGDWL